MPALLSTVACNLDADILAACYPLLEEERVEAIEWSFDVLFNRESLPAWFEELLHAYSNANRLIGHGVYFSLFSGKWSAGQMQWLNALRNITRQYPLEQVTEHFGFMTGKDFHEGAPISIPYTPGTLLIGRDRLKRIQDAAGCPVGLENLAFAYSIDEVKRHGDFLSQLIEPVNGFIILDLHNLYCHQENFSITTEALLSLYPLDKVREIHISGGSWETTEAGPGRKIRRDTHDSAVPDKVFELLAIALGRCANCKYVVLEQLGNGLKTAGSRRQFYNDFKKMEEIVSRNNVFRNQYPVNDFLPAGNLITGHVPEDETLFIQQRELSAILESSVSLADAMAALKRSSLANNEWNIESWDPAMLETAMQIAKKWKKPATH